MQGNEKLSLESILERMKETNAIFDREVVGKGNAARLDDVYTASARLLPPGAPVIRAVRQSVNSGKEQFRPSG